MTYATSVTETYSTADIENVWRRFTTDLRMIADSSGAITRKEAEEYGFDLEYLAKLGYLKYVDITLLEGDVEVRAVHYKVNKESGELTTSRPGGVLWPKVASSRLRVVIGYFKQWHSLSETERAQIRTPLKISWGPNSEDISHSRLATNGGRSYASNAYGIERTDYSK